MYITPSSIPFIPIIFLEPNSAQLQYKLQYFGDFKTNKLRLLKLDSNAFQYYTISKISITY